MRTKREKAANVPDRPNFPGSGRSVAMHGVTARRARNFYRLVARLPKEPNRVRSVSFERLAGGGASMDGIIYLVGLIVIVMFILSMFGLR